MLKVNLDRLKEKLAGAKEQDKSKNPVMLKATEAGKVNFRAIVYPHSPDPESEPFPTRFYHYNIAGEMTFYCPKQNDGNDCHICNYIWNVTKDMPNNTKEQKDAKLVWFKKLPNGSLLIPGIVRGKEEEGPKFLKIGTRKGKASKLHEKIFGWFYSDDPEISNWADPTLGSDIELEYEEYDAGKRAALGGAKFGLKDLQLARKPSKFGSKPSYEEMQKLIKDIDTIFLPKTTEDSLNLLKKWNAQSGGDVNKDSGTVVGGSANSSPKPDITKSNDIEDELAAAGL